MKKICMFFVASAVIGILIGCSSSSGGDQKESVTFKLATPDPDSSPITVAAEEYADLVEEESEGRIKIEVHANGSLYGEDPSAGIKQLGSGSLDMLVLSTSLYANFNPEFNAISIPYLFDDLEQFNEFLDSNLGEELLEKVEPLDIEGLGYWPREFRQITNSVRPIEEPNDLDGLKIRVPNNPLWVDFFEGAGTVTTPMDFGEVYNALQLDTIDGQENPIGVAESSKMYEVQDYLTISNHMAEGWIVGMNDEKFDNLSEKDQQILVEASDEIKTWKAEEDVENTEEIIEKLEAEGMKVNELSDEQREPFIDISKDNYSAFKELVEDDEFFEDILEFVGKN